MVPKKNSSLETVSGVLGKLISVGLLIAIAFTALAFGTVEAWSIAIFSLLILTVSLLWVLKCLIDRELMVRVAAGAWPLLVLIGFGVLQTIARVDESGRRFAISLDVEATHLTLEIAVVLLASLLLFTTYFAAAERLSWMRIFLVIFGLAISVFGLVQKFTPNETATCNVAGEERGARWCFFFFFGWLVLIPQINTGEISINCNLVCIPSQ